MASIEQQVRALNEQRLNIWSRGKEILDRARDERRNLTSEESANFDKLNEDISRIDKDRDDLVNSEGARRELEQVNEEFRRVAHGDDGASARNAEADAIMRDFLRPLKAPGRINAIEIDLSRGKNVLAAYRDGARGNELRTLQTDGGSSGGSLQLPTMVHPEIYAFLTGSVAMRRMNTTQISTPSGAPMLLPKVATHGVGTQVASQTTAFSGTDPVFGSVTLNAYDFGELVAVSNDMLEDSGADVLNFIAQNVARAVGQVTATGYISGSGSSTIQGIQGAITSGQGAGTVSSGGSLFGLPVGAELEKLIDVQYTIADSYRQRGASWLMRDLTGAKVRKIRDGAGGTTGQFVWQPSPTVGAIGGQPDTFLGSPVYFDPNVASMASNAKIVFYGDFSAYWIRDVGGFRLERSDDLYFDTNRVAFRGLLRTDGDLLDPYAITALVQNV